MKAVAEHYDIETMIELGLRAGIDIFLICHTEEKWQNAHAHLLKMGRENDADRQRIFQSANRVMKLKQGSLSSWRRPWARYQDWRSILGREDHKKILSYVEKLEVGQDPTEK